MAFEKDNTFITGRLKSIGYAVKGAAKLVTTEHSVMVQFSIGIAMIFAGIYFDISAGEWMFQTLDI
jgi:diacylglycerol kinase (ATP)